MVTLPKWSGMYVLGGRRRGFYSRTVNKIFFGVWRDQVYGASLVVNYQTAKSIW